MHYVHYAMQITVIVSEEKKPEKIIGLIFAHECGVTSIEARLRFPAGVYPRARVASYRKEKYFFWTAQETALNVSREWCAGRDYTRRSIVGSLPNTMYVM